VHFFGYFLCASKESDSAARKADEKTQGREPVIATPVTTEIGKSHHTAARAQRAKDPGEAPTHQDMEKFP